MDTAVFARVPLELSGRPARPVPWAKELDHAGLSALWRLGKKLPAGLVSARFRGGRPVHGAALTMMDAGMRGLARLIAR